MGYQDKLFMSTTFLFGILCSLSLPLGIAHAIELSADSFKRVHAAQKLGVLKGILWHWGESDRSASAT